MGPNGQWFTSECNVSTTNCPNKNRKQPLVLDASRPRGKGELPTGLNTFGVSSCKFNVAMRGPGARSLGEAKTAEFFGHLTGRVDGNMHTNLKVLPRGRTYFSKFTKTYILKTPNQLR